MPRFSIKDLMLAITLVAVGTGLVCFANRCLDIGDVRYKFWELVVCWWVGGWLAGAGLFIPFKRAWTGVVIALAIQFLYLLFGPAVN